MQVGNHASTAAVSCPTLDKNGCGFVQHVLQRETKQRAADEEKATEEMTRERWGQLRNDTRTKDSGHKATWEGRCVTPFSFLFSFRSISDPPSRLSRVGPKISSRGCLLLSSVGQSAVIASVKTRSVVPNAYFRISSPSHTSNHFSLP